MTPSNPSEQFGLKGSFTVYVPSFVSTTFYGFFLIDTPKFERKFLLKKPFQLHSELNLNRKSFSRNLVETSSTNIQFDMQLHKPFDNNLSQTGYQLVNG